MTPDPTIAVHNAADLVNATPYVLGFHPSESLVVLGLSAGRVCFGARYDLPPPDRDDIVQLGAIVAAQRARCVAVLAYGPPATADPVVRRALAVFEAFRVRVLEAVRVHDGRWSSYFCSDSVCCPAEGTPFDSATSLIAAEATYRGHVALPSRQALVAQVAPVSGAARAAMAAATERACSAFDALLTDDEFSSRAIRRAGRLTVREAEKRYRSGRALTDDETAWLGVLLLDPDVHEYTLGRLGDEEWRFSLWTDVLRRVEQIYVPAVGCILSYLAWRAGQGALARVAVDRALLAQPDHRMAALLDEVLGMGIGPHALAAFESTHRTTALLHPNHPGQPTGFAPHGAKTDRAPAPHSGGAAAAARHLGEAAAPTPRSGGAAAAAPRSGEAAGSAPRVDEVAPLAPRFGEAGQAADSTPYAGEAERAPGAGELPAQPGSRAPKSSGPPRRSRALGRVLRRRSKS
jgi:hypothetical protein